MPTKITQFACTGDRGEFKETTVDAPTLKSNEILIKIIASGVCHTDCAFMGPNGLVLGHEPIGRIVEAGNEVKHFKVGDVVGTSYLKEACLSCSACNSGNDVLCSERKMFPEGNSNGFASHQIADSRFVYRIPDHLEPKYAGPLMCAGATVFNSLFTNDVSPTARVAVVGIGGLGHLALQFARGWGCHVTAISTSDDKKQEATSFGAHDFLNSKTIDADSVSECPKFDYILNTVSANIDSDLYMSLLKPNGKLILIGLPNGAVEFKNPIEFVSGQKSYRGAIVGGRHALQQMLEFADRHQIKPTIEEYSLDLDGLSKAIKRCDIGKARYRAVLLAKDE
ncbi:hypothetical protein BY458DRAFT_438927 [Sporodiniella umbellata]|nr:hypothetical protein BY458DRAFT_438927 [Sporodiniella umbellata]